MATTTGTKKALIPPEPLPIMTPAPAAIETRQVLEPRTIELLRKLRADKMAKVCELDIEIRKLDEEITFLERHPEGDRILRRLAGRFNVEPSTESPLM